MRVRLLTPKGWPWATFVLAAACNAYEPGDLVRHEAGAVGAGGTMQPPRAPTGGRGGSTGNDPDNVPSAVQCGDGEVALTEKCDIAIPEGEPGACPRECPPIADCVARMLNGSNCDAECVVLSQLCKDDDRCCPSNCNHANDADCSEECGDGIVQEEEGETCEPDADAGVGCPTEDDCEDGDPCTLDLLIGSANNCNAACSRSDITAFESGDSCCPDGANANTDSDCTVDCGNGVREGDEQCDGGEGCEDCRLTLTEDQMSCLSMVQAQSGNACDRCACMQCTALELDCRASGNATRDMHCTTISKCANDNDCARTACYCADPMDPFCLLAGPCRLQIDAAAISDPSGASVTAQSNDPDTAIGKVVLASDCKATNCADVCP